VAREMIIFPSVPTSPAGKHKAGYFTLRPEDGKLQLRFGPGAERVATLEPAPVGPDGPGLEWLGDCALGGRYSLYAVCSGVLVEPAEGEEPPKVYIEDPSWHTMAKDGRVALVHTDGAGPSLLELDTGAVELIARSWLGSVSCPSAAAEFEAVLRHARNLHRVSMYGPEGVLPNPWSTPCRSADYQRPMIAMWDTLHVVLDMLAMGEKELAARQLMNHYAQQDERTGQMAQDTIPGPLPPAPPARPVSPASPARAEDDAGEAGQAGDEGDEGDGGDGGTRDAKGRNFGFSQPPLWAYVTLEVADRGGGVGSDEMLADLLPLVEANLGWWEANRLDAETGLFCWRSRNESGADNTPRFGGAGEGAPVDGSIGSESASSFGAADLTAQMHLSYEAAAEMARRLGRDASRWTDEAESTAGAMNSLLWSEEAGLYLDYDLTMQEQVGPRTPFGLFALLGSAPGPERAARMMETLTDTGGFWRELPVPTVAVDEPSYSLDMWRGPVWLSLNLWIAKGLVRWGRGDLASELARRSLRRAQGVLEREGCIFEFYPADGMRMQSLRRKGSTEGPRANYIGHAPLYALAELL